MKTQTAFLAGIAKGDIISRVLRPAFETGGRNRSEYVQCKEVPEVFVMDRAESTYLNQPKPLLPSCCRHDGPDMRFLLQYFWHLTVARYRTLPGTQAIIEQGT